jgi:Icc-related predicted phosphoesterase
MKLFFATDVHGSDICWKKFISGAKFYEVDTLILGGDMTGKAVVPIIAQGNNKWKVTLLEQENILEARKMWINGFRIFQNRGYYPYVTTPDEVAEISSTPGRSG